MVKCFTKVLRNKLALYLFIIFIIVSLAPSAGQTAIQHNQFDSQAALTFGFLPMQSPIALFKRFAPLRDYLSAELEQEIRLESAKDFHEYAKRTAGRQYDILLTAPHMALAALDKGHYELAATFAKPLKAVIVTSNTGSINELSDLSGKIIATPPPQAIVTLFGMQFLQTNNLSDMRFKAYRTHNAAYDAVLANEAQAALVANFIAINAIMNATKNATKKASKNTIKRKQGLKIIAQSPAFPGAGILVAQDLPGSLKTKIKKVFWDMKSSPKGKAILKKISQPGYIKAHRSEFELLRPYIDFNTNAEKL